MQHHRTLSSSGQGNGPIDDWRYSFCGPLLFCIKLFKCEVCTSLHTWERVCGHYYRGGHYKPWCGCNLLNCLQWCHSATFALWVKLGLEKAQHEWSKKGDHSGSAVVSLIICLTTQQCFRSVMFDEWTCVSPEVEVSRKLGNSHGTV